VKSGSSFEAKVLLAFSTAVLVVAGLSITTWKLAEDASETEHWVSHTHEVLYGLTRVMGDTVLIELSTQSYRITGDPARLAERDAAIAARETTLRRIKQLTTDNALQQENWKRLNEVIAQRLAITRHMELLRKTQGIQAANDFIAGVPLKETRERLNRILQEMEVEESSLLEGRKSNQLHAHQSMVAVGGLVSLLLLMLLTATYVLIRRQLQDAAASRRALADSEKNLSTTLHSIGDAVLATDAEGRITRMNPVAERLTGWSFAQAQGRPVNEVFRIVHEETRESAEVPVAKALATGEMQRVAKHALLIARDGSECLIANSAAPIRDDEGPVSGVVLVFRDVTFEQQAQQMILQHNELLEQRVRERTAQLHASEDHFRSVISNVPAMIAYVDEQQRYVYVNDQYLKRFAPGLADITGCTVHEILGDDRYAIAAPLIAKALQGEPQAYDWQPFPGVWQVINYVPKRDTYGQVVGYYVLGTEITERKQAEEKIRTLNIDLERHVRELEHVSRALRTLSAGNRAMLRSTEEQELLDNMCHAIVNAGGYSRAMVWYRNEDASRWLRPMAEFGYPGGLTALRLLKVSCADDELGRSSLGTAIRKEQTIVSRDMHADPDFAPWRAQLQGMSSSIVCPLRMGGEVFGALAIYDPEPDTFDADEVMLLTESADDLAFGITILRERAEQQKVQEKIRRLTRYDALTGLPNEAQFAEFLVAAIDTSQRCSQPFAVLQTNVERLSEINDVLGFSHGDQMLREFGARLSSVVPELAKVARLRGNEFAILLPSSNATVAIAFAQRLDDVLSQPFPIADISLDMSAKVGIALFPEHGSTPHDLFRHMDIAMHQAKKKDVRYIIFDPTQNVDQSRRLSMAVELRRAIEDGDLLLYLQPKVEFATGRVCGAEGLVRWQHAKRGLIPPGEFIGLAEHTGLIKALTEWVITTGLRLNHDWVRKGCALPIAINLSARNLRDENLLETIRQLQTTWDVAAGLLELEITESMVMDDAEFSLQVLRGLRDQGIPLYIDDFGTGYSSLSYLQKLPVEYIKIDQSFVRDMSIDKDSALIVRSTIDLAHDLGRKVVAEGVETQEQWNQLAALGCDIAQGYFIARPMPAEDFPSWVEQFHPPGCNSTTNAPEPP
jgi:diguanylate cyclase (GGDEF)-like protein/PAS domain S-box-containing protein